MLLVTAIARNSKRLEPGLVDFSLETLVELPTARAFFQDNCTLTMDLTMTMIKVDPQKRSWKLIELI